MKLDELRVNEGKIKRTATPGRAYMNVAFNMDEYALVVKKAKSLGYSTDRNGRVNGVATFVKRIVIKALTE